MMPKLLAITLFVLISSSMAVFADTLKLTISPEGWSPIAIPLDVSNVQAGDCKVDLIVGYNPSKGWETSVVESGDTAAMKAALKPGKGYFLHNTGRFLCTLTLNGVSLSEKIALNKGWNLVSGGTFSDSCKLNDESYTLDSSGAPHPSPTIQILDAGPNPKNAYWFYVDNDECLFEIPASPPIVQEVKCVDSDVTVYHPDGRNIFKQGTAKAVKDTRSDECTSPERLLEIYCDPVASNEWTLGYFAACPSDYKCSSGACSPDVAKRMGYFSEKAVPSVKNSLEVFKDLQTFYKNIDKKEADRFEKLIISSQSLLAKFDQVFTKQQSGEPIQPEDIADLDVMLRDLTQSVLYQPQEGGSR